jgi:hypothetical protein
MHDSVIPRHDSIFCFHRKKDFSSGYMIQYVLTIATVPFKKLPISAPGV